MLHRLLESIKDSFSQCFGQNLSGIDPFYIKVKQSTAFFNAEIDIDFDPIRDARLSYGSSFWRFLSSNSYYSGRSIFNTNFQNKELIPQSWFIALISIGNCSFSRANTAATFITQLVSKGLTNTGDGVIMDSHAKFFSQFCELQENRLLQGFQFIKQNLINIRVTINPVYYSLDKLYNLDDDLFRGTAENFQLGLSHKFIPRENIEPRYIQNLDDGTEAISSFNLIHIFNENMAFTCCQQYCAYLLHEKTPCVPSHITLRTFENAPDLTPLLCGSLNEPDFLDVVVPAAILSNSSNLNPAHLYYVLIVLNVRYAIDGAASYINIINFFNVISPQQVEAYRKYPITQEYWAHILGFDANKIVSLAAQDRAVSRAANAARRNGNGNNNPADAVTPDENGEADANQFNLNIEQLSKQLQHIVVHNEQIVGLSPYLLSFIRHLTDFNKSLLNFILVNQNIKTQDGGNLNPQA